LVVILLFPSAFPVVICSAQRVKVSDLSLFFRRQILLLLPAVLFLVSQDSDEKLIYPSVNQGCVLLPFISISGAF